MGIWARVSSLVSANVHALLDRAEDPERMMAQVVREMEDGLAAARAQGATAIALARRLGRDLEQARAAAAHWKEQARLALESGREDLARQALARKVEQDETVRVVTPQAAAARQGAAEVKTALRVLEDRLAEMRRKQRILLARHRAARVRLQSRGAGGGVLAGVATASERFARFEDRLLDLEDGLLAEVELGGPDEELAGLTRDRRIGEELAALRAEIARGGHDPGRP